MPRILVRTNNPAWFVDVEHPEGKKVRKQSDDQIFDNILEGQEALEVLRKSGNLQNDNGNASNGDAPSEPEAQAEPEPEPEPKVTKAPTGKELVGETVEIRCAWIEGGKNTGKPYEAIKLKSGKTIKGLTPAEQKKACGKRRTIKPQDLFQARYCVEHQEENRKARRREKQRARTAARKAKS